jgi:agmatinase
MFCGILKRDWLKNEANYHMLGVPLDITSTYRTGARLGPDYIRKILLSENFECVSENGLSLNKYYKIQDWGNVGIINTDLQKSLQFISEGIYDLVTTEQPFLILGGDHSATIGVGEAYEKANLPVYYIYIDAHLDLYDEVKESKYSHACTLRRLSEMKSFQGASVFGYRDFTRSQLEDSKKFDIEVFSTDTLLKESNLYQFAYNFSKHLSSHYSRIHVSVDLDVLDPGFAPAVGNPVAAGISTRNLIWLLTGFFNGNMNDQIISWDIVEFNPLYDYAEVTSFTILKIMIESLGAQIRR